VVGLAPTIFRPVAVPVSRQLHVDPEIRRYRGRAGSSFPFLRRSALIPSRTLMHGSPWLRASAAIKIRRRRQNIKVRRLGDSSVVILRMRGYMLGDGLRLRCRQIITPNGLAARLSGVYAVHRAANFLGGLPVDRSSVQPAWPESALPARRSWRVDCGSIAYQSIHWISQRLSGCRSRFIGGVRVDATRRTHFEGNERSGQRAIDRHRSLLAVRLRLISSRVGSSSS
jgi:hypothetical protein